MEFAIAKISTKGQLVIPASMRKDIRKGDEFLLVRQDNRFVLRNMRGIAKELKDDLGFAQRVEEAWQDYENGKFETKNKKDFLKELYAC